MAKGTGILINGNEPKGRFIEGIISGALYPGTCVQIKAATEPVNGRFTYEAYNKAADGDRAQVIVLLEDQLQGGLPTQAYVSGDRAFFYVPVAGDELNMLFANIAGTGDHFAIGDQMMIDDGTGKLIATTGTPQSTPFTCEETVSAITADTLVACSFNGY